MKAKLFAFPLSERMKQQPSRVLFDAEYRTLRFSIEVPNFTPVRVLELVGPELKTDLGYVVELDVQEIVDATELLAFVYVDKRQIPTEKVHELSRHIEATLDAALLQALRTQ